MHIYFRLGASAVCKTIGILDHIPSIDDPFKMGWVKTDRIRFSTNRESKKIPLRSAGTIKDGDWDRDLRKFTEENKWYEMISERYTEGISWLSFEEIQKHIQRVESGGTWRGCENIEEIEQECEKWDNLYRDIKNNGYKSQIELIISDRYENCGFYSDLIKSYDEITVDVGRSGELLFVNGRHRLAIAKLLDIELVPVRVDVRHKKFVEGKKQVRFKKEIKPFNSLLKHYFKEIDIAV